MSAETTPPAVGIGGGYSAGNRAERPVQSQDNRQQHRRQQHKTVVRARIDGERTIELFGREAWALSELVRAGATGVTPLDNPGPRWSAYVHALRNEYQIAIETRHETHQGDFPGNHARYVLVSNVAMIAEGGNDRPGHE